jgi:peptidylprolyl isomerase
MDRLNTEVGRLKQVGLVLGVTLLCVSLTSCTLDGGSPKAESTSNSPSNPNSEEQAMAGTDREYISVSANAGMEPTIGKPEGAAPTTLVIRDVIVGDGDIALVSSTLTAHYQLISWKSGEVLQSSWKSQSFDFTLGGVIAGWQQGIPGMKVGGRRLLVIPPDLAYGAAGSGPIGPNETLAFVVDLIGVQ